MDWPMSFMIVGVAWAILWFINERITPREDDPKRNGDKPS